MGEGVSLRDAVMAIGAAAVVTYALRLGGLLLATRFPRRGRFRVFMEALPGAILVSLIAPGVFTSGLGGYLATATVLITALKTRNAFIAMLTGMLVMVVARRIGT